MDQVQGAKPDFGKVKGSGGYVSLNRKHRGHFLSDEIGDNIFGQSKPSKQAPPNSSQGEIKNIFRARNASNEILEEVEEHEQHSTSNKSVRRGAT